jgi:hypothetical protein
MTNVESLRRMSSCSPAMVIALLLLSCGAGATVETASDGALMEEATILADRMGLRARVSACLGFDLPSSVAFLGDELMGGVTENVKACVGSTTSCEEVLACAGVAGPGCSTDARCDGSRAIQCRRLPNGISAETVDDCAADASGNGSCAVVTVPDQPPYTVCSSGDCGASRCDGDMSIRCLQGAAVRTDCKSTNRICAADWFGATCVHPEACEQDHCDGDQAVFCRAGHVDVRQDCASAIPQGRCREDDGAVDCVARPMHPRCSIDDPFANWCEQTTGYTCFSGALIEVDCKSFLDGWCEASSDGVGVRCRVSQWP